MSAHIYDKNNELRFLSVIHNAGVGGSSPPVATIKINHLPHYRFFTRTCLREFCGKRQNIAP